jgi:hypothetical protein
MDRQGPLYNGGPIILKKYKIPTFFKNVSDFNEILSVVLQEPNKTCQILIFVLGLLWTAKDLYTNKTYSPAKRIYYSITY